MPVFPDPVESDRLILTHLQTFRKSSVKLLLNTWIYGRAVIYIDARAPGAELTCPEAPVRPCQIFWRKRYSEQFFKLCGQSSESSP